MVCHTKGRRVFDDMVLKRIFESKRDKVTGGWRRLYNGSFTTCSHHHIFLQ